MPKDSKPALKPKLRFPEFRDEPGWEVTTIDKISDTVIAGGTPDTSEPSYWDGHIRWMASGELNLKRVYEVKGRITEAGLRHSSTKVIPPRCVLIGLAGQGKTRGTVAMNMVELCTNQSIAAIFPNDAIFDSTYLYHNLDSRYSELRRLSAGSEGRGGLNLQIIKSLLIPLPSRAEQQKVAECLSTLDELIEAESQRLETLRDHKNGLLQQLFPREGETRPRLRFPEFRSRSEWEHGTIGRIAIVLQGYGFPEKYQGNTSADFPFYKVSDISRTLATGSYLMDEAANYIDRETLDKLKAKPIPIGTTIFAKIGEALRLNRRALTTKPCLIDNNVAGVKAIEGTATDLFLYYLFSTISLEKYAGGVVPAVSKSAIEEIEIFYPGQEEQIRISDCLSSLDCLIAAQSERLEALRTHKRGLMQQLFPCPSGAEI